MVEVRRFKRRMAPFWERLSKASSNIQNAVTLLKKLCSQGYVWGFQPGWTLLCSPFVPAKTAVNPPSRQHVYLQRQSGTHLSAIRLKSSAPKSLFALLLTCTYLKNCFIRCMWLLPVWTKWTTCWFTWRCFGKPCFIIDAFWKIFYFFSLQGFFFTPMTTS